MADQAGHHQILPTMPYPLTYNSLKGFSHLIPGRFGHIFRISENVIVKYGHGQDRLNEANTMRFIQANTQIPIPEVFDAYLDAEDSTHGMLVMSYIEGDILQDVWSMMTQQQKESIISQLRGFISQLRRIKSKQIGKANGTACEDPMFDNDQGIQYGPYHSEDEFNRGIVAAMALRDNSVFMEMVSGMVFSLKDHEIVLTHGDLVPRNIIVRNAEIVGILDWELAGFWPEYWEYTKALYMPDWEDPWITQRVADRIMDAYHLEHAVLRQVRDVFW